MENWNIRRGNPRADYTYTVEGGVIAIVDMDQGSKSVTNDMENVLDDIRNEIGDLAGYAVIYRDSMGRAWQETPLNSTP